MQYLVKRSDWKMAICVCTTTRRFAGVYPIERITDPDHAGEGALLSHYFVNEPWYEILFFS
jgi:hypothetical protein